MSNSSGASSSENSPPLSFKEFEDLVKNTERFYALGSRLSQAIEKDECEYLIQEASMAFTKALMSLLGFLRFIPSSQFHAKEGESLIDLSSAAVMARQVLEDVLSFLYLSEANLPKEQKDFREFIWRYHGLGESIESAELLETVEWSNPDLPATRELRAKMRALLIQNPLLAAIETNLRGRIREGDKNWVLYENEVLERRGIIRSKYDLPRKVLSNFVHFSTFSHHLILETDSDWRKSWPEFFMPTLSVAAFIAEALKVFVETFPQTRSLLIDREQKLIENYRAWIRDKEAQPK
jgi:hypothetical protein